MLMERDSCCQVHVGRYFVFCLVLGRMFHGVNRFQEGRRRQNRCISTPNRIPTVRVYLVETGGFTSV